MIIFKQYKKAILVSNRNGCRKGNKSRKLEKYPTLVKTWNYPKKRTAYKDINLDNIMSCASSSGSPYPKRCNLIKVSGSDNSHYNKYGLYIRNGGYSFDQVHSLGRSRTPKPNKIIFNRGHWSIGHGPADNKRIKSIGRTKYPLKANWLANSGTVENSYDVISEISLNAVFNSKRLPNNV